MNTEAAFQKRLDECPEDWQTRLVFADWLQEHDDPRAEGYRALGTLRIRCDSWGSETFPSGRFYWEQGMAQAGSVKEVTLPTDWWRLLPLPCRISFRHPERNTWRRRTVENAAALAFAKLPAERRDALLNLQGAN